MYVSASVQMHRTSKQIRILIKKAAVNTDPEIFLPLPAAMENKRPAE